MTVFMSSDIQNSLNQWSKLINLWATEKGWNDDIQLRSQGDWVALAHSECSEALEEWRRYGDTEVHYSKDLQGNVKPEGVGVEYADLIIRVLHWAAIHGVDMGELVQEKMVYNNGRIRRHGDIGRV